MTKQEKNYKQLRAELDELMGWFDQDDIDVDKAIDKYKQAIELAKELETYLKNAENKISKLA